MIDQPFKLGQLLKLNPEFFQAIKFYPLTMKKDNECDLRSIAWLYCNTREVWFENGKCLTTEDPPVMYLGFVCLIESANNTAENTKQRILYKFLHQGTIWCIAVGIESDAVRLTEPISELFVPITTVDNK